MVDAREPDVLNALISLEESRSTDLKPRQPSADHSCELLRSIKSKFGVHFNHANSYATQAALEDHGASFQV